jgi:MFS superfamily sulfate permease-like transporter
MSDTNNNAMTEEQEDLKGKKEEILKEIQEYNKERDQIKSMLGKIGGKAYSKLDTVINIVFLLLISIFFLLEITTHWLPSFISLEISVLLVSIKIVWMIHSQQKFNHFQFWILNSIEYRMNQVSVKMKKVEKEISSIQKNFPTN